MDLSKPLDTKKTGLSIGGFSDLEVPSEARYSIHKKNELAKPHINYESRTIVWYKTLNFERKKQADLEKAQISVILYYKIDHFSLLNVGIKFHS